MARYLGSRKTPKVNSTNQVQVYAEVSLKKLGDFQGSQSASQNERISTAIAILIQRPITKLRESLQMDKIKNKNE